MTNAERMCEPHAGKVESTASANAQALSTAKDSISKAVSAAVASVSFTFSLALLGFTSFENT